MQAGHEFQELQFSKNTQGNKERRVPSDTVGFTLSHDNEDEETEIALFVFISVGPWEIVSIQVREMKRED